MTQTFDTTAEPAFNVRDATPRVPSATRPFYWSVRRELWEHPSIYIAPLSVAALVLFGFVISVLHLSSHVRFGPVTPSASLAAPYDFAAVSVLFTMFLVAIFYSLSALHGERRDRSILFWKSLPVSDLIAVLSKASIPLVVLPAVAFVAIFVLQMIMLMLSTLVLLSASQSAGPLWAEVGLVQGWIFLLYSLIVLSLWHAPIYGWLLLVSGWARRAPFLWAVLPPLALCLVEKIAFSTSHFGGMLTDRIGGFTAAYVDGAFTQKVQDGTVDPLSLLDPVKLLATPRLWIGLVVAAAFIAAAVWLRRRREPI